MEMELEHFDWAEMMQAELNEFKRKKVCNLVPTPPYASLVGLKWIFYNKIEKEGNLV